MIMMYLMTLCSFLIMLHITPLMYGLSVNYNAQWKLLNWYDETAHKCAGRGLELQYKH